MVDRITLCSATLGEDGKSEPPLGPLYIAATLRAIGVEVDFRDYQLAPGATAYSAAPLVDYLEGHAPVVAISCFVDMLPAVVAATRELSGRRPGTTIVLGGPGPSAAAGRLLELYPWLDAVVRGEGEETIREWVDRRNGKALPSGPIAGMTYREGGVIVAGPDRPRTADLDALPGPAFDLLDWSAYSHGRVVTTRGCAYRCSFCDVTALWGNSSVYRDVDGVIDEMVALAALSGSRSISIADDTFVQDRKRVRRFCDRMIERRAGISWGCFARINLMSPELIARMAEAGCRSVFYGIDSGSPAVVARTHKMVRVEDVAPVIRASAAAFDDVEASFIWGYPFESLDDFRMTLGLAAEVAGLSPVVNIQVHRLCPLPNSPIYREHPGPLVEPEPGDRPWALLPDLLGDGRSVDLRDLIRSAPEVYPGYYTFPTPEKEEKRRLLERVDRAILRTIGASLLDPEVRRLVEVDAPEVERRLIDSAVDPCDRIGVAMAVSSLRRKRRRASGGPAAFAAGRGPTMARGRNDG